MKNIHPSIAIIAMTVAALVATLFALMFAGLSQEAFTDGRAVGEQLGYEVGFKDGDISGRKRCCKAVCAAEDSLGLFDEGGCFCVAPKDAVEMLQEAEQRGLLEDGVLPGTLWNLPPGRMQ